MNIADLKKLIQDLPDDSVIGVIDHYGELIEINVSDLSYYKENEYCSVKKASLHLPNVDIGPEPD